MTELFDKSGGYRRLDSFTLATLVQLATLRFCERFLNRTNDPCGRQYDQMTQAARSGRSNIIEGSERASTSKETEMKLTDVARASLAELRGDYEIWILSRQKLPWKKMSPEAQAVYNTRLDKPNFTDDWLYESAVHLFEQQKKFAPWLESDDSLVIANAMLIVIGRVLNMLEHQLHAQGEAFKRDGGFRERATTVRVEARNPEAPECPVCGKPMARRKASTGKHAGEAFWGCTGYPQCTATRKVEE